MPYIWAINEQQHAMNLTKVSTHQTAGTYKPTAIDAKKAACDFLVIDIAGVIDWKDGRREFVSAKHLKALKASHSWMTNF